MNDRYNNAGRIGTGMSRHGNSEAARESLRQSGLDAVGAVPWGTHFCQFYATAQDLLDTLVPYFRQGLAANEFCMWVTSAPLEAEAAKAALAAAVPGLDACLARGQIEILDYRQWYTKNGSFDAAAVLQGWQAKLAEARRRGFEGLRLCANTFWLEAADWQDFNHYENMVHGVIGGQRMLALCTYSLEKCGLREILGVVANHEFALIKQGERWELLRSIEHQAELALRESRERLQRFTEIAFEGIVVSENGKVVDCNEQFAGLLGYTVQELQGMSVRDLVAPEDRERVFEQILLSPDGHMEHALIRRDGSRLFVESRGKNNPFTPARRYTAVRDISEHKQVLEDLNRAQAVGHIGSWRLDIRRNELRWSDENHRIFGLPKGTPLTYETFLAIVHPEDRDDVDRMWKAALRGEPYDIEHRLMVDGRIKWVREKAELELDDQGVLLGGFGTTQDITDRKQDKAALMDSEERFRAMVQAVPSITYEMDGEGACAFFSESWSAYTGMRVDGSNDFGWAKVLHPEDHEMAVSSWAEAVRSGAPCECKYRLRAADGSFRWFIDRALPTRDAEGKIARWAGSITDIDDLIQAQQALQKADLRKDEFLAMLAHELRNPLVPVRNAAHVLGRLGLEEPRIKWVQETIEGQVAHLTRLVDDLLDVSRIVRGKISLKKEEVEFAVLAERALEAARPLLESKRHRLLVHLPAEPVRLEVDPVRVTQVLLNLLDNAAKYSPEGGSIAFDARVDGTEIEIQVRDSGMGIPAELLPHVFELFQQGERTLERAQGGLGIGLTLVQRLVEMHGGRVAAHSEGAGKGATFSVRLPNQLAPAAAPAGTTPAPSRRAAGLRVLVVDDEPAVADSTAVLLELEGHQVRVASSGLAALELLPQFQPQAVLLDIGLEGMDGFETARRLRQLPEGRELCLMAITGYGDTETRIAALEAGCDHHLVKPVTFAVLNKLLAEVGNAGEKG